MELNSEKLNGIDIKATALPAAATFLDNAESTRNKLIREKRPKKQIVFNLETIP